MSGGENEAENINYFDSILVYLKSMQSLADLLKTKFAVIPVSYHPLLIPYYATVYMKC
jgi:hypothetical protein